MVFPPQHLLEDQDRLHIHTRGVLPCPFFTLVIKSCVIYSLVLSKYIVLGQIQMRHMIDLVSLLNTQTRSQISPPPLTGDNRERHFYFHFFQAKRNVNSKVGSPKISGPLQLAGGPTPRGRRRRKKKRVAQSMYRSYLSLLKGCTCH